MKKYCLLISCSLLSLSFAERDFNVEDLPFNQYSSTKLVEKYRAVAKAFIDSKTPLEASKYLTDSSPEEMKEFTKSFLTHHKERIGKLTEGTSNFNTGDTQIYLITTNMPSGGTSVIHLLWENGMKEPKVDWRASYAHCEMDWDEFFQKKPKLPVEMRVRLVKKTFYYNFDYSDEETWACYAVHHPFLKRELFAYIKRSEIEKNDHLKELEKNKKLDVTVSLFFPDDIKDEKQVEIAEIKQHGWFAKNYYDKN